MKTTIPSNSEEFLTGRFIASLGTESEDGSILLTAVWYIHEAGFFTWQRLRGPARPAMPPTGVKLP